MIKHIHLRHFRNFEDICISFSDNFNLIVGDNGVGKSNILEAISLLHGSEIFGIDLLYLVREGQTSFYIESEDALGNVTSLAYEKENKIKKVGINGKNSTLTKIQTLSTKVISFHPLMMNLMYLSPSLRRDFLDAILLQTHINYKNILKQYKNVLRSRNIVLKKIREGKASSTDLSFWNEKFIAIAEDIYMYRREIITYFQESVHTLLPHFNGKATSISFQYKTKVNLEKPKESISAYLLKNEQRDSILGNTHIGPHIDDFDILINENSITSFASRGEIKSCIIGLKMIEARYIEEKVEKKPIILIDDLLSEIDEKHKHMILSYFGGYQTIATSIKKESGNHIITLI